MTMLQWKQQLEPSLMGIHGVLNVETTLRGLTVNVFRPTDQQKEAIYAIFEANAPDLPFKIASSKC
jgi:hypothetical protein